MKGVFPRKAYESERLFTLRLPTGRRGEPCIMVHAYDANLTDPRTGHQRIDIEVRQGGRTIFARSELCCAVNRWTSIDGTEAKELVLSTVAMKPGDADREYFASYTPEQLNWAVANGEFVDMVKQDRYCDPETGEVRRGRK